LTHTNQTSTTYTGSDLETYSFRARAQDRAGNIEDYPATVDNALTVKLPEPTVTIIKPTENKELAGKTTVTGTCQKKTDGRSVTKVEWRIDNGTWTAADGTLNWTFSLDTTKLKDGKHTLQVRTYDGKHYSTVMERPFSVKNAQAKGVIGADGALLLLGCIGIGLALFARRRK
jgi:Bacterial Ig domain